jgi:hypothetical protein
MTKDEALEKKAENAKELGLDYDPENTLHWYALNYRTAPTQNAQAMFEELEKFVAKRTWVGLTDGEIEVIEALKAPPVHPDFIDCDDWMDFARAIETKLKEKNT